MRTCLCKNLYCIHKYYCEFSKFYIPWIHESLLLSKESKYFRLQMIPMRIWYKTCHVPYSGRIWLSLRFRHHPQLFRRQIWQISSVVIRSRLVTHSSLCMIHQKTGGDKMWQDHGTMLILTPERTSEDRSDRSADTSLDLCCTLQIRLICAAHYRYIWSTLGCDWFDWSSATPAREGNGRSREQKIFSASSQALWQESRRESCSSQYHTLSTAAMGRIIVNSVWKITKMTTALVRMWQYWQ